MTTATATSPSASKPHGSAAAGLRAAPDAARCVVLGVAASKRWRGLQAARAALGLAPACLVEWRDFLVDPAALARAVDVPAACRLKLEPPGDDPVAHAHLLARGAALRDRAPPQAPRHGELLAVDLWFAGFGQALRTVDALLATRAQVRLVNACDEILRMTDKWACQQHLRAHGVPVPALLGEVAGHDALHALADAHGIDRVFVKARYGSSAAGVIAWRRDGRGREQATSSARVVETDGAARLFNDKRLRGSTRPAEIARLVDLVCAQGAYAEAWIPKPRHGAGHFDLRVLALDGRPAHRVARVGLRPMTNLHLDGERADPAALLDADELALAERLVVDAARAFPRSGVIGFDLVVRGAAGHVLEANAFGDLLPRLLWRGLDPYGAAAAQALP